MKMKLADVWRHKQGAAPIYAEMKDEWHWYAAQARASGNMPNVDQLESIKNGWVRLIPRISSHRNLFLDINERERIRLRGVNRTPENFNY
jgi:hypothetical protein